MQTIAPSIPFPVFNPLYPQGTVQAKSEAKRNSNNKPVSACLVCGHLSFLTIEVITLQLNHLSLFAASDRALHLYSRYRLVRYRIRRENNAICLYVCVSVCLWKIVQSAKSLIARISSGPKSHVLSDIQCSYYSSLCVPNNALRFDIPIR